MKFKYTSQKKTGEISGGIIEASDKFAVARLIREQGEIPLSTSPVGGGSFLTKLGSFGGGSIKLREKIMFTRNLSGMLQAGLSLSRALTVLEKQTNHQALKDILRTLVENISKGSTLSEGMHKFPKVFSGIFISMVRAGEESGGLPAALSEVGNNLQKSYALNKKVKSALMYPSVIVGAIFLIGILMLIYVVPTLTKTFTDIGVELPASTQFVIWISDTLSNHFLLFLFGVIGIFAIFTALSRLPRTRRYIDFIILRLPVIGIIVKEMNAARTTRTLSSLLSSGVDMSKALSITCEVLQNSYYKELIEHSIASIEKGLPLSDGFKTHTELYPVMVGEMMEVGEETGKLSSMLIDIANFYEEEVDNKTKNLSTIIEPVLMIFIGAAVGFFAISMISPMYSVLDTIQ